MVRVETPRRTTTHCVFASDGTPLSAEVHGPDDAPVTLVLAHGWCLDRTSWAPVLPHLPTGESRGGASEGGGTDEAPPTRVVAYDHRGHGRSGRDHRPRVRGARASIRTLADDLSAVIDRLAPEGPLVLAGHSMGGMTIMALAALRPDLVRDRLAGVALVSTAARSAPGALGPRSGAARVFTLGMRVLAAVPPLPVERADRLPERLRRLAPREAWGIERSRRLLFGHDSDPSHHRAAHRMIGRTALRTVGAWYGALSAHDEVASLAALHDVPVRVLVGERDRLTPPRDARLIADALPPTAVLDVMPHAGHMLPMERPVAVAGHLAALLEEAR